MADDAHEIRRINWGECFGFLHLFRAFRLALSPQRLALAFAGLAAIYLVGRAMDLVWMQNSKPVVIATSTGGPGDEFQIFLAANGDVAKARDLITALSPRGGSGVVRMGVFEIVLHQSRVITNELTASAMTFDIPGVLGTIIKAGRLKLWLLKMHLLFAIVFFVAGLAIWALFGGALARHLALDIARDEKIGVFEALRFSREKFLSFFAAPLFPVGFVALISLLLALFGGLGAIPYFGELAVGIGFFLAVFVGFVGALAVVGGVGGGWLMFPAIAVEGSDSFDGLNRAFAYVYQRPWRLGFYALASMAYGAICITFVKLLARLTLVIAFAGLGSTMNIDHVAVKGGNVGKLEAMWQGPTLEPGTTAFTGGFDGHTGLGRVETVSQFFLRGWIYCLATLVGAFAVTLATASSTLIYFLLRRDVDATAFDDIYLDDFETAPTPAAAPGPTTPSAPGSKASLPIMGQK